MIEDQLSSQIFKAAGEKTFIDKVTAKDSINEVKELISKKDLTRVELGALLNKLSSEEIKLLNYDTHERYYLSKFFVWVREFVAVAMQLYDYKEKIEEKHELGIRMMTSVSKEMLNNSLRLIVNDIRFLVDLYFNLSRSSLSIDAHGFDEIIQNKFEISYPQGLMGNATQAAQQKHGWARWLGGSAGGQAG